MFFLRASGHGPVLASGDPDFTGLCWLLGTSGEETGCAEGHEHRCPTPMWLVTAHLGAACVPSMASPAALLLTQPIL